MCIVNHNPTPAVDHSNISEQTNYSYNLKTNLYPQNNQVMKQVNSIVKTKYFIC